MKRFVFAALLLAATPLHAYARYPKPYCTFIQPGKQPIIKRAAFNYGNHVSFIHWQDGGMTRYRWYGNKRAKDEIGNDWYFTDIGEHHMVAFREDDAKMACFHS
jgi:hypothetical protein